MPSREQEAVMIVDYYRDHRIDVNAVQADGRWNAEVAKRRLDGDEHSGPGITS